MTNKFEVVPATLLHAQYIAPRMREADVQEIWAVGHRQPYDALVRSMHLSADPATGMVNGHPICMFGVGVPNLLSTIGTPWLLGTPEIEKYAKKFLRLNKSYIDLIKVDFDLLYNWVDQRNTASIRWLKWLGFTLSPPAPYGIEQKMFHYFEMRNKDV